MARLPAHRLAAGLLLATPLLMFVALWIGPVAVTPAMLFDDPVARTIVFELRLPRILAAALIGAALGASGALLQALLRNPLADPALIGVSGGAALGAACMLAIGGAGSLALGLPVPVAAFIGGLAATLLVWRLGAVRGQLQLSAVLLAGIAINTLAGALVGLLLTFANDPVLRATTFWLFGSLTEVRWPSLLLLAVLVPPAIWLLERRAVAMDVYQLGDIEARHAGTDVRRLQWEGVILASLLTGLAVASAGIIGFIGLMVPHFMRLLGGPGHSGRFLQSALSGALLLLLADAFARTAAAPAEIPVGLLTALIGAPFFLLLLRRELARGALRGG
ncbi:MAG: iron ABC transporter permease [Gammaproteobacteria bacterium]|nr:iron ABC transporter permease [Gammaproteobacteria bacterium]